MVCPGGGAQLSPYKNGQILKTVKPTYMKLSEIFKVVPSTNPDDKNPKPNKMDSK